MLSSFLEYIFSKDLNIVDRVGSILALGTSILLIIVGFSQFVFHVLYILRSPKSDSNRTIETLRQEIDCLNSNRINSNRTIETLRQEIDCLNSNNTTEALTQEIDRLNSTRSPSETCIICFTNPINSIFIPCCHLCACTNCSINLKQCPICRREVLKTYRVFKC